MIIVVLILSYLEYLAVRAYLIKFYNLELDMFPDRYGDDPKRTWTGAGILLACFFVTMIIYILLFGADSLMIKTNYS